MTNPLPPDIRFLSPMTAVCLRCNAVMRTSQPWQLMDLCRRHAAESHPDPVPPSSPPATVPIASP